jgi:hypothetical protein
MDINVSETILVFDGDPIIYDTVSITEDITLSTYPVLSISGVQDSITVFDGDPIIYDSVSTTEVVVAEIIFTVSIHEDISITEAITLSSLTLVVDVHDHATLTVGILIPWLSNATIGVHDHVTVTEENSVLYPRLISKVDTITVYEGKPIFFENISITETVGMLILPPILPSVSDNIALTEYIEMEFSTTEGWGVDVHDHVTVSENEFHAWGETDVSVSESITVTGTVSFSGALYVSVHDHITVTEQRYLNVSVSTLLYLDQNENIAVSEYTRIIVVSTLTLGIAITPDNVFSVGVRIHY